MGRLLVMTLLPIVLGLVVGYIAGRAAQSKVPKLTSEEKRELNAFRDQEMELIEKASEAATLGDDFGVTALSIISRNRTNRSIR